MKRRRSSSLAGSPVLVGAATILIVLVALVLSYNASRGLPFIKTYDLFLNTADAKKLTTGSDVRVGGKRVGQVNKIEAIKQNGGEKYYARLTMNLDQTIAELPKDTTARIRPRNALGQKFVELFPGDSSQKFATKSTIPESQASSSTDLDEVTSLFDENLRSSVRNVVANTSTGLAGRGAQVNAALGELPGTLDSAQKFLTTLSDPRTGLGNFLQGLDSTMAGLQPVTSQFSSLFRGAQATLGAIADEEQGFGTSLEKLPPTLREARTAATALSPTLRDAAGLLREVRPGVRQIPATVNSLSTATRVGVPILKRVPVLTNNLNPALRSVDGLVKQQTLTDSLTLLAPTAASLNHAIDPLLQDQVQCNYAGLWAKGFSGIFSEGDANGNWFRVLVMADGEMNFRQPKVSDTLNYNAYNAPGKCSVGNETYGNATKVGPGAAGGTAVSNPNTSAPPNTPKGPR